MTDVLAGKASDRRSATVRPLVPPPTMTKSYLLRSSEAWRLTLEFGMLAALVKAASDRTAVLRKPILRLAVGSADEKAACSCQDTAQSTRLLNSSADSVHHRSSAHLPVVLRSPSPASGVVTRGCRG